MRPIAILPVILLVACAPARPNRVEIAAAPTKPATTATLPTQPQKSGRPEKGNTLKRPDKKTTTPEADSQTQANSSPEGYRLTALFASPTKQPDAIHLTIEKLTQTVAPVLPEFARQLKWLLNRKWEILEGSRIEYLRTTKNQHRQNDLELVQAKAWMVHNDGVIIFNDDWKGATEQQKTELFLAAALADLAQFQGEETEYCKSYHPQQSQSECTSYRELSRRMSESEDPEVFRFFAQKLLTPGSEFVNREILIEVLHKLKIKTPYLTKFDFTKETVQQITQLWEQAPLFQVYPARAKESGKEPKVPCRFQFQDEGAMVSMLPEGEPVKDQSAFKLVWPEPHVEWIPTNGSWQIKLAAVHEQGHLITLSAKTLPVAEKQKPILIGLSEVRIEKFVPKSGTALDRETVLVCQTDNSGAAPSTHQEKNATVRSGGDK